MSKGEDLRLSSILIRWYDVNKRDLPWRETTDPYVIWMSEIILQQTRVNQGLDYFNKFMDQFPTVTLLAEAEEQDVLKLWEGLGYYSRARNLHAAAKYIVDVYNGVFPSDYKDILALKGVGEYTAAAIVSFAYNQPYAVVDGNVYRVLSRVFAIDEPIDTGKGKKIFAQLAQELIDTNNAGEHNQAIMEFGALQCVPVSPNCDICTAQSMCLAYAHNKVSAYPVKSGKQKVKKRYFHYFDITSEGNTFLHKRIGKDIWQNLYELPLIETSSPLSIEELQKVDRFKELFNESTEVRVERQIEIKHVLSHQIIYATFYKMRVAGISLDNSYLKIKIEEVENYPVSRLINKYYEQL